MKKAVRGLAWILAVIACIALVGCIIGAVKANSEELSRIVYWITTGQGVN
jgi:hypothetical protein